jgi:hypothetical protein
MPKEDLMIAFWIVRFSRSGIVTFPHGFIALITASPPTRRKARRSTGRRHSSVGRRRRSVAAGAFRPGELRLAV